eukprot:3932739-Rhodomonas_salina.1
MPPRSGVLSSRLISYDVGPGSEPELCACSSMFVFLHPPSFRRLPDPNTPPRTPSVLYWNWSWWRCGDLYALDGEEVPIDVAGRLPGGGDESAETPRELLDRVTDWPSLAVPTLVRLFSPSAGTEGSDDTPFGYSKEWLCCSLFADSARPCDGCGTQRMMCSCFFSEVVRAGKNSREFHAGRGWFSDPLLRDRVPERAR